MEPLTFYCYSCGGPMPQGATSGGICTVCSMKIASKSPPTGGAVQVITWEAISQDANAVTANGNTNLANTNDYMDEVIGCLTDHMGDTAGTNAGDQYTIWKSTRDDTVSVDYQGTRAGTGSTFWIDLQGQAGKDNARVTHWQIMVECAGSLPPREVVAQAIRASLGVIKLNSPKNAVGIRVVIRRTTATGLPASQTTGKKSKK
jgi:hypothetical protein